MPWPTHLWCHAEERLFSSPQAADLISHFSAPEHVAPGSADWPRSLLYGQKWSRRGGKEQKH